MTDHVCEVQAEQGWCPHDRPLTEFQQAVGDALNPLVKAYTRFAEAVGNDTLREWMDEIESARRRSLRYRFWRRCTIVCYHTAGWIHRVAQRCEDHQWSA